MAELFPISQNQTKFESAWGEVKDLAKKFEDNHDYYHSSEYNEASVRKEFIDKFFIALGWDVNHVDQHDPYRQEVKIEKAEKKSHGRADYAFSIAPMYKRVRFFVEAKKPISNIVTAGNCFQAIRYSWPQGIPVAVLMDFASICIIDSRYKPKLASSESRVARKWSFHDYKDKESFLEIYWLLSREAVEGGSIENFADNFLPEPKSAAKQYSLFPNEAREFDDVFLAQLDEWRYSLANAFKKARKALNAEQLTECVQRTIDRLVFIRFLEDKGIEPDQIVSSFGQHKKSHWNDFVFKCKSLDQTYNGIVFKPHNVLEDPNFQPNAKVFEQVCEDLTDEDSPYNFDYIPVEILGRIYERFLGKVVEIESGAVAVVEKEDVRKAGGVYYTPDYIVNYMVSQTLEKIIGNKTPDKIKNIRIIDTACGSGSFLLGAFDFLVSYVSSYYRKYPSKAKKGVMSVDGETIRLSLAYKRELLLKCIFGVDIDMQAVEVAQLSLYLKLMEEETLDTASQQQQIEMGIALLPSMSANILVGNSLVSLDHDSDDLFSMEKLKEAKSLDFKAAFPLAFKNGGFDLVIGNPPYIKEGKNRNAFNHVRQSDYYQGKMDIWYLFACRAMDWLKPDIGIMAFIATNNWVTNTGARTLRANINARCQIEQFIDFGTYKVFRDANVQTMIMIAKKSAKNQIYDFDYRKLLGKSNGLKDAQQLLEKNESDKCELFTATINRARDPHSPLTFSTIDREAILVKIENNHNFRLMRTEVAQGIVAPQDSLNQKNATELGAGFKKGDGIFVLKNSELRSLKLKKVDKKLLKPLYTSTELQQYGPSAINSHFVIYTSSDFKSPHVIKPYAKIKQHLDRFKQVITSSNKPYGLHRARNENFFVGNKIMSLRKCAVPTFTYTDFPCYVLQTYYVIKTDRVNLLVLTAILNSRITQFWLRNRGKMQGQNYQIDKEPLLNIPILLPSDEVQIRIEKLSKALIECKKNLPLQKTDADIEFYKQKIQHYKGECNKLIEEPYNLTAKQMAVLAKC